jgi:hypothetical protein
MPNRALLANCAVVLRVLQPDAARVTVASGWL